MSNKTPYELRFDVLQMARDLEMQQYEVLMNTFWSTHMELERAISEIKSEETFDTNRYEVVTKAEKIADKLIDAIPTMPTSDQINRRAKELYEFVENK